MNLATGTTKSFVSPHVGGVKLANKLVRLSRFERSDIVLAHALTMTAHVAPLVQLSKDAAVGLRVTVSRFRWYIRRRPASAGVSATLGVGVRAPPDETAIM
mgnify:CR=1 FL=1